MTGTRTRIAVVTGAGSGIGRAVAVELPLEANVQFATVLATTMPYGGAELSTDAPSLPRPAQTELQHPRYCGR
ncbi:hypothetical protein [Streptomyces sp. NPDC001348]